MADIEVAPPELESVASSHEAEADQKRAEPGLKRAEAGSKEVGAGLKAVDLPTILLVVATIGLLAVTGVLAFVTWRLADLTEEDHQLIIADELQPPGLYVDPNNGLPTLILLPSADHQQILKVSCLTADNLPVTSDELRKELKSDSLSDPQYRLSRGQPSQTVSLENCHSPDKERKLPQFAAVALVYWSVPLQMAKQQKDPARTVEVFQRRKDTNQYEIASDADNGSTTLTDDVLKVMDTFGSLAPTPNPSPTPVSEQVAEQPSTKFSAYALQPARGGTLGR